MRLLLDTHTALWAISDDPRLTAKARDLIFDPANDPVVSVVSVWEIAIKHALSRPSPARVPISAARALGYFMDAGYRVLPVTAEHALAVEGLPLIHADPFDRLLVAQALVEPLRLLTHDDTVARYSDTTIHF